MPASVTGKKIVRLFSATVPAAVLLAIVAGCSAPYERVLDSQGRPYSSERLAKEWREGLKKNYPSFAYPRAADNDADYYYPYQNPYRPNVPRIPYAPPQPPRPKIIFPPPGSYPQDNDADYVPSYPTYDPEEDNSGYYYQPNNKKLPPPKKEDKKGGKKEPVFDYPIYFDE